MTNYSLTIGTRLSIRGSQYEIVDVINTGNLQCIDINTNQAHFFGYTDLMVDGAPSPHQSDTTLRWLIDRLRS